MFENNLVKDEINRKIKAKKEERKILNEDSSEYSNNEEYYKKKENSNTNDEIDYYKKKCEELQTLLNVFKESFKNILSKLVIPKKEK